MVSVALKLRPRTTAVVVLRLCAVPFGIYIILWAAAEFSFFQPTEAAAKNAHIALVAHSGTILSFMGGMQQSAACASSTVWGNRRLSALVLGGIGLALFGLYAVLSTAIRGPSPTEPMLLAAIACCQPMLEALLPKPMQRKLLHDHRQTPMLIATIALLACAHRCSEWPRGKREQIATVLALIGTSAGALKPLERGRARARLSPLSLLL